MPMVFFSNSPSGETSEEEVGGDVVDIEEVDELDDEVADDLSVATEDSVEDEVPDPDELDEEEDDAEEDEALAEEDDVDYDTFDDVDEL